MYGRLKRLEVEGRKHRTFCTQWPYEAELSCFALQSALKRQFPRFVAGPVCGWQARQNRRFLKICFCFPTAPCSKDTLLNSLLSMHKQSSLSTQRSAWPISNLLFSGSSLLTVPISNGSHGIIQFLYVCNNGSWTSKLPLELSWLT